ncbi:methyl-accepting chemotaxis protein [Anaeromusa acidaminophila]|uniref:methyl-accepting chemotaxis protein n=1 Tax=Anaeromusa acidaminophila TaxID=81464 RepID=UPI00035FE9C8|nr:HAMP domain-containing methyl-accepting chemotaxis protein [Anaeromusa acidaminophila]
MSWNISKKITAAFLAVIALVAIMSAFTYYEVGQLNDMHITSAKSNLEKMYLSQGIALDIANEAVAMRRFNFTGDANDITVFNAYRTQGNEKLQRLDAMLSLQKNKDLIQKIQQEKSKYEGIAEKSFAAKKTNDAAAVGQFMDAAGAPYKAAMSLAMEMVSNVDDFVKADQLASDNKASGMRKTLLFTNLLVAILAIFISRFISGRISRPAQEVSAAAASIAAGDLSGPNVAVTTNDEIGKLGQSFNTMKSNLRQVMQTIQSSAEQVTTSSEELTASAEQSAIASTQVADSITSVAQGAAGQLHAIENASATVQTLSAGLEEAAASAHEVSDQSSRASRTAVDGAQTVSQAVKQMQSIQETVNFSASVVSKLGESSQEIGQIVDTISGIAAQTNLLALNAAIEAARAGEQGRGFAVVAEEVRHLAEQSQDAAKKITELISEIQGDTAKAVSAMQAGTREVETGVEVVNSTGTAFKSIETIVLHVADQMKEMSTVIEHMAQGSQEIVTAVAEIDRLSKQASSESENVAAITEEQSAAAEEIAASSQGLEGMAQKMQEAVSKFRL